MTDATANVVRAVHTAIETGRLSATDGQRLLGRMLLEAAGFVEDTDVRRELVAVGVDPSMLEAAYEASRLDAGESSSPPHAGSESNGDVANVLQHLERLGAPAEWTAATTYDSLAQAIIDSVWSIGVRYGGVLNVLERYRALRHAEGRDPAKDTPEDLLEFIESLGGPEAFADAVRNRQRTSSRSGILKADAVLRQARMLAQEGIESPQELASADPALLGRLRRRWTQEVGQASGLSWDYLLMLSGLQGVKADRMVRRFVADALGCDESAVSASQAHSLVTAAAKRLGLGSSEVDYAIWRFQSGQ